MESTSSLPQERGGLVKENGHEWPDERCWRDSAGS